MLKHFGIFSTDIRSNGMDDSLKHVNLEENLMLHFMVKFELLHF